MQGVQILGDRFLLDVTGRAIDLASGSPVVLKLGTGGGAAEQLRWAARCDALARMVHPSMARLIDFGGLGESSRFEAWRCGEPFGEKGSLGARSVRAVSRLLSACRLTEGRLALSDVHVFEQRPVVVPASESGYPLDGADDVEARLCDSWPLHEFAMCLIDRRADSMLEDLFATLAGSRPHIVSIWGPPGSGCTTAGLRAARMARLNGFIPIGTRMVDCVSGGLLAGRQLCFISDEGDRPVWSGLLRMTLASPRPHVVVRLGRDDRDPVLATDSLHGVSLEPIPADKLAAAVRPKVCGAALERVSRAAEEARGLPGRFAARLWSGSQSWSSRRPPSVQRESRVAEQPAVYGGASTGSKPAAPAPVMDTSAEWSPSELAAFRQKADAAATLLRRGRHAPAVRQLRQVFGALHRRHDWASATAVALTIASALLRRGDVRGALAAVDEGRTCAGHTACDAALIDAAILAGHARIDAVRLDEAESVLGTALAAARRIEDPTRAAAAALALARCLFWQGRYADATSLLTPIGDRVAPDLGVRILAASARAAVGSGNLPGAASFAREAMQRASSQGDPALMAHAALVEAFVHLSACDLDGVDRDVRTCVGWSRRAHDPLLATRARLLLAESDRRRGRPPSSFVTRVRRIASLRLPALVRARVDLLQALLHAPSTDSHDAAARHAIRIGLPALSLFGPSAHNSTSQASSWIDSSTADLVGILHLCQTAEDEAHILGEVCARVRRQLHAAAVAILVPDNTTAITLASDGARIDAAVALRAISAGLTLAPHRLDERLESAAPIRYGGVHVGALAARWPPGTPYDLSRAPAVLTMAATASAPVVASAIAHRARPATPALADLIGVTPRMSDLRRAIERAASAPFAVLVEGESGSGKELVAKAIHRAGLRRDRPFCTLNCAALPDDLVEAELFGHARGAFTGAVHERAGVFEEAHGGTLLLDEVGELSPRAQAKLLRVIQEGELRRIGENTARRVDVRVVAATNRDLRREVAEGRFRLDLLYRLDVIRLVVPPLRDRREDIGLLADHCWREATVRIGSRAVLATATLSALARYDWPGNVRELQNVLASLAVRTPRRGVVTPEALPAQVGGARMAEACRLDDARRTFEERFVRAALVRCGGHRTRAASELGLTRQGLTKLLVRLRIEER